MADFEAENNENSCPNAKGSKVKNDNTAAPGGRVLAMAQKIKERLQPLTPTFGQKTGGEAEQGAKDGRSV
jgi:hypothetical protein